MEVLNAASGHWNQWMDLQWNYDCHSMHAWSQKSFWIPATAIVLYLSMLHFGRKYMSTRPAFNMKHAFALWNLFLSVFSCFGTYYVVPGLLRRMYSHGFHHTVCNDDMVWGEEGVAEHTGVCWGPVGFWMTLFCLSKVPELLDTFFLVFQKKNVMFLHWYHHVSVLAYCWWAIGMTNPGGLYFGAMNYVVHSVMYFYFFAATYWYKLVRPYAKLITWMQISQMVCGVLISTSAGVFTLQGTCSSSYGQEWFTATMTMYGSYFVLFAKLYYDSHVLKKGGAKERVAAAATKTKKAE